MQMNFLSTLKIADVTDLSNKKDKTSIAIEAFLQKIDVQLKYAEADKAGVTYTPERTRKEPAKRDPLNLRWYSQHEGRYVGYIKVGRQPTMKDGKPVVYEMGKTLDDVIQFFTALRKAATERDASLVKLILDAKAAGDKAPAETAPAAQPAKGKGAKA